jgi:hypothetical protein
MSAVERMKRTGEKPSDPAFSEAEAEDALQSVAYERRTGSDGVLWQRLTPGHSWERA